MDTLPKHGYITTFRGQKFYYDSEDTQSINIEDIAHALANTCRFSGHSLDFYSVAEHSVWVSKLCDDPIEGLLHEGEEAYLCDLPSPLKRILPDYRAMQDRVRKRVCEAFQLTYPFSEDLKDCDWAQLKTEAKSLLVAHFPFEDFPTKKVSPYVPLCLDPEEAEVQFLRRYHEILNNGTNTRGT